MAFSPLTDLANVSLLSLFDNYPKDVTWNPMFSNALWDFNIKFRHGLGIIVPNSVTSLRLT